MTKEEIISIMLEINRPNQAVWSIDEEALEQWLPLLQAIAAAEREACAVVAEKLGGHPALNVYNGGPDWYKHGKQIAAKIRARGQE